MKKEMSPGLITVIAVAAVVILVGGGFLWFGRATTLGGEDPDLARKQWEVERSRTPGGGAPPEGFAQGSGAPGRDAEMAARQQHSGQ